MKLIKVLIIVSVVLLVLLFVAKSIIQVEVNEDSLPTNVYEEDSDLLTLVNSRMFDLFVTSVTNEYTVVEEVVNLVILDSIRDNINSDYDPLSDCDTTDCNFIVHDENYYVKYIWAELSDDDQLIIHVSLGSEAFIGVNTIFHFYFDIEIDYIGFGIELTLDSYYIHDNSLSMDILDNIFSNFDTAQIESEVSKGELDLEEYSYRISFNPLT